METDTIKFETKPLLACIQNLPLKKKKKKEFYMKIHSHTNVQWFETPHFHVPQNCRTIHTNPEFERRGGEERGELFSSFFIIIHFKVRWLPKLSEVLYRNSSILQV